MPPVLSVSLIGIGNAQAFKNARFKGFHLLGLAIAVMVVCQRVSKAALARCTHASPARAYQYIGIKTLLRHETVMVK